MKDLPLGLPKGSVRALLALIIIGSAVAAVFVEGVAEPGLPALWALAGVIGTYYFKQRESEKEVKA